MAGAEVGEVDPPPAVQTGPPAWRDARRALRRARDGHGSGLARAPLARARVLRTSLDWEYVAEQSRVGAPWYYRLAGVWGGMEGSLLLFTGIVGAAAVLAARRATVWGRWAAAATVLVLALVDVLLASPFGRLDVPATIGFGMNPILEHPAMAIHPPMLYAGLAAAGGAAVVAVGAPRSVAGRPAVAARVGRLLTAAMTLGAAWSYMEQGWGGYWAWDPVENTSLLVWMAALVGDPRRAPARAGRGVRDRRDAVDAGRARRRARCDRGARRRCTASPSSSASAGRCSRSRSPPRSGVPGCSCAVATRALRTQTPTGDV